jgi:hypothetical protein
MTTRSHRLAIAILMGPAMASGYLTCSGALAADTPVDERIDRLQKELTLVRRQLDELRLAIAVATDGTLRIGSQRIVLEASDGLSFKSGQSSIQLQQDAIAIKGPKVQIESAGDVSIKGARVTSN